MPNEQRIENHLRQLDGYLDRIAEIAKDPAADHRTAVSGWSALQHAEHIRLATEASLFQLHKALERPTGPSLRLWGRIFLIIGRIPRGRGKAPKTTAPSLEVDRQKLIEGLEPLRRSVSELASNPQRLARAKGRASHPIFGGLTAARWLRFMCIHFEHHLDIVEEIEAARRIDTGEIASTG